MTPSEYLKASERTEFTPRFVREEGITFPDQELFRSKLMHAAMGLVTEAAELSEETLEKVLFDHVHVIEELGDLEWYVALAVRALGKNLDDIDDRAHRTYLAETQNMPTLRSDWATRRIIVTAGDLIDQLKKLTIYSKPLDEEKFLTGIVKLRGYIDVMCLCVRVRLHEVREKNIAKLMKRYPDKFTSERAINRDLDGERRALEDARVGKK